MIYWFGILIGALLIAAGVWVTIQPGKYTLSEAQDDEVSRLRKNGL